MMRWMLLLGLSVLRLAWAGDVLDVNVEQRGGHYIAEVDMRLTGDAVTSRRKASASPVRRISTSAI